MSGEHQRTPGFIKSVPFKSLKPFWKNRLGDQPRFARWVVTPVGGPPGFLNMNRDDGAVETESCTVGFIHMAAGVSSPGLHVHEGFDEVYLCVRGEVAVRHGDGTESILGPNDVAWIPRGVVHGLRNLALEDSHIWYFQTGVEREGFQMGLGENEGGSRWLTDE
jgi:mannose-6-phosphate isomerase-like protein (cupin superfamily)